MLNLENVVVLYVDSNLKIRKQHTLFMRENGLKVLEAEDIVQAHSLYQKHKVDIIVMDIIFPNENGLELIRHLRNQEFLTPVIITTSVSDQNSLLDAINLNITRYLIKPFLKDELIDVLKFIIKKLLVCHTVNFSNLHEGYYYDALNKAICHFDGAVATLSTKEYRLIELLLSNREKTIPYSVIETTLWQGLDMSMDALRTLVRGIRKKSYPSIISNQNGIGYKITLH